MEINLYNVDCFKFLPTLADNSVDLVLTDPPYGMSFQSGHRRIKYDKIKNDDNLDWLPLWINEINRVCKKDAHIYCFCSWHNVDKFKIEFGKLLKLTNILIWVKNNTGMGDLNKSYAPKYEMILFYNNNKPFYGSRDPDVLKTRRTNNSHHPTEKPVNLMNYLIRKSTKEGDLVLDCFTGSGSTAVACSQTNRNFIGCEIDENYYNIAMKRIKNEISQTKLFT